MAAKHDHQAALEAAAHDSLATKSGTKGALLGAMFLMATSAIGPGFITQTTVFTAQLGAAFAFAIIVSILVDIAVQLNVWRVIGVSGQRAQDLANQVIPGFGYLLAALVVFGGLVFNIGNIGGTGLGGGAPRGGAPPHPPRPRPPPAGRQRHPSQETESPQTRMIIIDKCC
jgi:hypothetical protein